MYIFIITDYVCKILRYLTNSAFKIYIHIHHFLRKNSGNRQITLQAPKTKYIDPSACGSPCTENIGKSVRYLKQK